MKSIGKSKELATMEVKNWLRQKGAVGDIGTTDIMPGGTIDQNDSFLASFEHDQNDLLNRIVASARFAPLNTRTGIPSAATVAYQVSDGQSIPVTRFSMAFSSLVPQKSVALAVISNEVLRGDPRAIDTLYSDLREGITLATDAALVALLKTTLTPIDSEADPANDIRSLLDAVNLTGFGDLLLCVSPKSANILSTWPDGRGALVFPGASPTGGKACNVNVYVTAAMSDDEMLLIDINGLLAGPQEVDLQLSNQTMITMDDAPGTSDDDGALVSMFQTESSCYRVSRHFGVKKVRPSAVALVSGIEWEVAS